MLKQQVSKHLITLMTIVFVVVFFVLGYIFLVAVADVMKNEVVITANAASLPFESPESIMYVEETTAPDATDTTNTYELETLAIYEAETPSLDAMTFQVEMEVPSEVTIVYDSAHCEELYGTEQRMLDNDADLKAYLKKKLTNLQNDCRIWFSEHKNDETYVTVWKKVVDENRMYVALKDEDYNTLVTFLFLKSDYEWLDTTTIHEDWQQCVTPYEVTLMLRDFVDVSYTTYHEVSGNDLAEVHIQTQVLVNRTNHNGFENTLRTVITEPDQYACKNAVINRILKDCDKQREEDDLEKCFRSVLLFFAEEFAIDVPDNVIWAATSRQGRGLWMYRNGTYYCF